MRKTKLLLLVPALLGATLLPGCQTWGPTWSELTGQRYNVTIMNRRPASINMVDNQGAFVDPNLDQRGARKASHRAAGRSAGLARRSRRSR